MGLFKHQLRLITVVHMVEVEENHLKRVAAIKRKSLTPPKNVMFLLHPHQEKN